MNASAADAAAQKLEAEKALPAVLNAEKIQARASIKYPGKEPAWKVKRRLSRMTIYALTGLLVICLIVILILLRANIK